MTDAQKTELWTIAWNLQHGESKAALAGVHGLLGYKPTPTPKRETFDPRTERNLATLLGGKVEAEFRKLMKEKAELKKKQKEAEKSQKMRMNQKKSNKNKKKKK